MLVTFLDPNRAPAGQADLARRTAAERAQLWWFTAQSNAGTANESLRVHALGFHQPPARVPNLL